MSNRKPDALSSNGATWRRKSRRDRFCDSCDRYNIRPGDIYLEHVAFPSNDLCNTTEKPSRSNECAGCATRYGRTADLGDMEFEQVVRNGIY
jgi:hypothetical protein